MGRAQGEAERRGVAWWGARKTGGSGTPPLRKRRRGCRVGEGAEDGRVGGVAPTREAGCRVEGCAEDGRVGDAAPTKEAAGGPWGGGDSGVTGCMGGLLGMVSDGFQTRGQSVA